MAREWKSAEYHRLSDPQFGWGQKVIQRLAASGLRGDEAILDAGCGTGRVTAALLERFPHVRVVAVDGSENMVRDARVTLARFGERATVEHLDLLNLPADQSFDVIFSTAVFHWIKDHNQLFANLYRALRPGGLLLAQCGGGPNLKLVRERADAMIRTPEYLAFFRDWQKVWEYPTPEVTAERLERARFVEVATGLEAAPAKFADAVTFREFCATVILEPYLERLSPELQTRFLDTITAQAAADDPPLTLDYCRLNLQGRRAPVHA